MQPIDPAEARKEYDKLVKRELGEMAAYREALEAEFKDADPDSDETAEKAKKRLIELVPDAATQIRYLLNHAESEAIKKDLAKFIFGTAMRVAEINGDEVQMQKLISSLSKN